jgi:hypothetical protein
MKSEVYIRNMDTGDESLARSLDAAIPHEERRTSTPKNKTRSSHTEVRIEMRLKVGFSNIYCEM